MLFDIFIFMKTIDFFEKIIILKRFTNESYFFKLLIFFLLFKENKF